MSRLLSFTETYQKLGVTRVTLYAIISRGELSPAIIIPIGKQKRSYFHEHEVDTLAKQRNPLLALELVTH